MGQRVPLADLPLTVRATIQPGTPAFAGYAADYEAKNGLPPGSITGAKLNFKPNSDPIDVLEAVSADKVKSLPVRTGADQVPTAEEVRTGRYTPPTSKPTYDPTEGMGRWEKLAAGMGASANDTWMGIKQMTGHATPEEVAEAARLNRPLLQDAYGVGGYALGSAAQMALPGSVAAKAAGAIRALPVAARVAPLVEAATGPGAQTVAVSGAQGAVQPVQAGETRLGNAAESAALGGGLAGAGQVVKAVARPALETVKPAVQALGAKAAQLGIPLRAAQVSDNPVVQAATKLADMVPFSGSKKLTEEQQKAYNLALSRSIGQESDNPLQALRGAHKDLTDAYDAVKSNNNLQLEPWHVDAMGDYTKAYAPFAVSKEGQANLKTLQGWRDNIANATDNNGVLSGDQYKAFRSELGSAANAPGASPQYKEALNGYKLVLDKAFRSGLRPEDNALLSNTDRQWANMKTLQSIAPTSPTGDFDFAKLSTALGSKAGANRSNRNALQLGYGNQELPDLSNIGTMFLKRGVMGSPAEPVDLLKRVSKATVPAVSTAGLMGGAYALNHDEEHPVARTAAELAALGVLGAAGGRYMNSRSLLRGSPLLSTAGEGVERAAPLGVGALNAWRSTLPPEAQGQP